MGELIICGKCHQAKGVEDFYARADCEKPRKICKKCSIAFVTAYRRAKSARVPITDPVAIYVFRGQMSGASRRGDASDFKLAEDRLRAAHLCRAIRLSRKSGQDALPVELIDAVISALKETHSDGDDDGQG